MIISIYSDKGGVGKSSISNTLVRDLDLKYVTNDISDIIQKYKKAQYQPKKMQLKDNTLYDFGGFKSKETDEIIMQSDLLIVPFFHEVNSVIKGLITIEKFITKGFDRNKILIIGNGIEKTEDSITLKKIIKARTGKTYNMSFLRYSKIFKNSMENSTSIEKIVTENEKTRYIYRGIYKDYKNLLLKIEKMININKNNNCNRIMRNKVSNL